MRNVRDNHRKVLKRNIQLFMLGWSVIVLASLWWRLDVQDDTFKEALHTEAAAMHSMDMQYRQWIIDNGGVYVPVSDKVKPNPWLSHVPERDVTTPSGKKLTLLNSAYLIRLVHEGRRLNEGDVRGHIVSLHPINPVNAADAWEKQALESFEHGNREAASFGKMADGKRYYRYMKPMVVEESCLKCHGKYGSKLGDVRGGVSVSIPVAQLLPVERHERNTIIAGHGLIWALGMLGLFFGGKGQARAIGKIAQGEAEIELLTNSMAHALYGQDVEGNCTFINAAGLKAFGYQDESELIGKPIHELVHHTRADGSPYPYSDCPVHRAVRDGKPAYIDQEMLWRKDGSSFVTAYWAYPVIRDGHTHGAVVTFLDITEQLRIKDELRESKTLLDTIVENIPAMVFLKRASDLRFELFNRAGETMLGYSRDDLLGKNDHDLFTREQADAFTRKDRAVLDSHQVMEVQEEPIKTADGSGKWLHTLKIGLYSERGEALHLLGISLDITRRKLMEDELRESEARLAEAQRMAHLGHWQLDLVQNTLQWSDEIYRIFEIDPQQFEASYQAFIDGIHPDDRAAVDRAYQDSLQNKMPYQIEHRLLMKDGRVKYVLEKAETTFDEAGKPLHSLGTVQDVTASNYAERALREQRQVLEQALEGTVHTASIAVELRDPYTAGHQRRVADLACAIAREMGLDEERIRGIRLGAQIHDIGKIGVPAEILSKPTRLTPIELQIVQRHAEMGFDILKEVKFPWPVAEIAHQHHERMDGSGYPQGLKGEQIQLEARIVAVADVVESMASHRPYRAALGIEAALDEIVAGRGTHYDEQVVDACQQVLAAGFEFS